MISFDAIKSSLLRFYYWVL